jgi:4-methylaminobutanoate oxidase (formaldehyde-forming)
VSLPTHAKIVIVGGGAVGCSIAYHLARRGAKDVLLLERKQLTSGCTWHAAGLVGQLRSKSNLTRMMQMSAELYARIGDETRAEALGHDCEEYRLRDAPHHAAGSV